MCVGDLERKRVLIAEDTVVVAQLYAADFKRAGFEPEVVHSGEAALERLASSTQFAALVLDIGLPGVDGRDVLAWVQGDEARRSMPVVVVSGRDDEHTRTLVLRLGARDLISKPVWPGQLVMRVSRLLDA